MLTHPFILLLCITMYMISLSLGITYQDSNYEIDVNKFITDYIHEVERTLKPKNNDHGVKKRSTDTDIYQLQGVDILVGFQEEFSVPVKFPNDLALFARCSAENEQRTWYAAALEANRDMPNISPSNNLVLYKHHEGVWVETDRVQVMQGVRLAAEQVGDETYILLVEFSAVKGRGSPIMYSIDYQSYTLQFTQMLDNHFTSDVIMWLWEDMEAFAAVAVSENMAGSQSRYSTSSPIYHWEGGSWNMVGSLPTHNPQALTQFTVGSSVFIAVANFQNDLGETTVSSDIFHFDLPTNNISLHQKLPTEAAVDIEFFCYQGSRRIDRFLVYASAFHTDEESHRDYDAGVSVVFKMSDEGYFIPFQPLRVPRIISWHPIRHVKNGQESLTLLAATNDGVVSFQYDGWRFVATGVTYDRVSFGPGPKSIKVLYFQDETLISVANKHSPGFVANVFSPVLRRDLSVDLAQQEFESWHNRFNRQLAAAGAKMASLLQIAQTAPAANDQVINLGSKVVFENVDIDTVETYEPRIGDIDMNTDVSYQLYQLSAKLEQVQREMKPLKSIIDQTTVHTLTVYKDFVVGEANIECMPACHTDDLEVGTVNGDDIVDFIAHILRVDKPIDFGEEVSFEHLALLDPLNAKKINGHHSDAVVDWTVPVHFPHGLQVKGDINIQGNLSVGGRLDGVAINLNSRMTNEDGKTVFMSPTNVINSLTASELTLTDQSISGVDFERFHKSTLKTQGDQTFTEFQDFENVEAGSVLANKGLFRADNPPAKSLSHSVCEDGKPCVNKDVINDNLLRAMSASSDSKVEAIRYIDDAITITSDFTIYGSVSIQNGSLVAQDLVDLKHNASAKRLMEYGIPLNQSVIHNHFTFHNEFEPASLTVDSLNGVNISSLIDLSSAEPVVVSARKYFMGGLTVEGTLNVSGTVNGVKFTEFPKSLSDLAEVHFDNLTILSLNSSHVEVGGKDWQRVLRHSQQGEVFVEELTVNGSVTVDNLHLEGPINDLILENLLQDTVYSDSEYSLITGKKHFANNLTISNMELNKVNGIDVSMLSLDAIWVERLSRAKVIKVDHLEYTGYLDGIGANEFGEWMLTEGDQDVIGSQIIESFSAVNANVTNVNSVHIPQLMSEAVYITDNATLDFAIFQKNVETPVLTVGKKLQGLKIPEDLLLSSSNATQQVIANKHVLGNMTIVGDLRPAVVSDLCHALSSDSAHIVISGNAFFEKEPNVSTSINDRNWSNIMENIWFKEDDIVIKNTILIYLAEFDNMNVTNINNNNVEKSLSNLVSLSQDETINGTFFFSTVTMAQGLEAGEATVGGRVQGLDLQKFVSSVLLDGENQQISGIPDFNLLIVDSMLSVEGLVNSLNLSSDVMLNNVASNTVTGSLTLTSLATRSLTLAPGSLLAGIDLLNWNRTVVKKSGPAVITGNVTFTGQFDSSSGIRVDGMVNNMKFDKNHLLLLGSTQKITGVKTFAPESRLTIDNLTVEGYFDGVNVSHFFSHLVSFTGNSTLSGAKKFSLPIYSKRAILPEMYQGYNLTRMEAQLSFPLPWTQYHKQLATLDVTRQLVQLSLDGRAFYLTNISRIQDIEGLAVFPLKSFNSTRLGVVRLSDNKTTLSLFQWNTEDNSFYEKPGSVVHLLKEAPRNTQPLCLPDGLLALYVTRNITHNSTSSGGYGEMLGLQGDQLLASKVKGGQPHTSLLAFRYNNRTCYIVVGETCTVHCPITETRRIKLPGFPCQNITQMSALPTNTSVYLAGLQSDSLVIWRMVGKRFEVWRTEPQFHPVSVAASTIEGTPLIAVANKHRFGHVRPETIDIYRLDEIAGDLTLEQQLGSISPQQLIFAELPSQETVLYVTSDNPATPLEVFVFRGVLGFVLFTVEKTLLHPTAISAFTDHHRRHFVLVYSHGKAHILQARFQGDRPLN